MKTPYLSIYLLAAASIGQSQSFVTQSDPQLTAGSIPGTCLYSYDYTVSEAASWTLWCAGNINIRGGNVTGTGNGACPSGGGFLSPCAAPNGSPAPTFSSAIPKRVGNTWYMSLNIGNASRSPVPPVLPLAYVCTGASATQATTTTNDVTCPPPPCDPRKPGCGLSPIIIDPIGEGFFLTSKAQGVQFREEANSPQIQISWTTGPEHHNAWLVRPNADGSVTSLAANMFGNLSPQPASDNPNGYSALAYWAEQEGCGTVERLAACPVVWQQLRLWHDQNQDGIAQPEELSTLDALGVRDISLKYHTSGHMDQYGNVFRFAASIYDDAGEKNSRSYDVFLIGK